VKPGGIRELIYVAAHVPKNGESLLELGHTDGESLLGHEGSLVFTEDQSEASVNPAILLEAFCEDCTADQAELLRLRAAKEPVAPLATPAARGWSRPAPARRPRRSTRATPR
jgi:hypothetical protein